MATAAVSVLCIALRWLLWLSGGHCHTQDDQAVDALEGEDCVFPPWVPSPPFPQAEHTLATVRELRIQRPGCLVVTGKQADSSSL